MTHLGVSIFDLPKASAVTARETGSERLENASTNVLDTIERDGLIETNEGWIHRLILQSMVQSGALRVSCPDTFSQLSPWTYPENVESTN